MLRITIQERDENRRLLEQEFEYFKTANSKEIVDEYFFDFYRLQDKVWNKGFKDELKHLKEKIAKIEAIKGCMTQDKENENVLLFKTKTSDFRLDKNAFKILDNKRLNTLYKVVCLGY